MIVTQFHQIRCEKSAKYPQGRISFARSSGLIVSTGMPPLNRLVKRYSDTHSGDHMLYFHLFKFKK